MNTAIRTEKGVNKNTNMAFIRSEEKGRPAGKGDV